MFANDRTGSDFGILTERRSAPTPGGPATKNGKMQNKMMGHTSAGHFRREHGHYKKVEIAKQIGQAIQLPAFTSSHGHAAKSLKMQNNNPTKPHAERTEDGVNTNE